MLIMEACEKAWVLARGIQDDVSRTDEAHRTQMDALSEIYMCVMRRGCLRVRTRLDWW